MSPKKRRVFQHIMEDRSFVIFKQTIPNEWVVHEYKPDYGIDVIVEIFQYIDRDKEIAETLGDLFFVQLKSLKQTCIDKIKVFPRGNVEKSLLREDKSKHFLIEVIKYNIETSELLTIQSMGASIPVLLVLVSLDLNRLFFVCLNDLIDKVILPQEPDYETKKSKTIYIPVKNEIGLDSERLLPLEFYAKRAKLYSAFLKFKYQFHELQYATATEDPLTGNTKQMIEHFIGTVKRYDFWGNSRLWIPIEECYKEILQIEQLIAATNTIDQKLKTRILMCWYQLANLSDMYEELCREWFLPTFFSQLTSYPDTPEPFEEP